MGKKTIKSYYSEEESSIDMTTREKIKKKRKHIKRWGKKVESQRINNLQMSLEVLKRTELNRLKDKTELKTIKLMLITILKKENLMENFKKEQEIDKSKIEKININLEKSSTSSYSKRKKTKNRREKRKNRSDNESYSSLNSSCYLDSYKIKNKEFIKKKYCINTSKGDREMVKREFEKTPNINDYKDKQNEQTTFTSSKIVRLNLFKKNNEKIFEKSMKSNSNNKDVFDANLAENQTENKTDTIGNEKVDLCIAEEIKNEKDLKIS